MFTPPTKAPVQQPSARLAAALSRATRDEEHAVSTVREGPLRPKAYETLFEIIEGAPPVPEHIDISMDEPMLAAGLSRANQMTCSIVQSLQEIDGRYITGSCA